MMADLKEYTVKINGIPHTMLLTKEDAQTRGLLKATSKAEKVDVEALVAEQVEARVTALEAEFDSRVEAEVARRAEEANTEAEKVAADAEAAKKAEAAKAAAAKSK